MCLVNVSASEKGSEALMDLKIKEIKTPPCQKSPDDIITTILRFILNEDSHIADPCSMILSNLTRHMHLIEKIVEIIEKLGCTTDGIHKNTNVFDKIVNVFTKKNFNKKGAKLNYLGPVLSNLTQSRTVRKYILDREKCIIQQLIAFTEYKESTVRRGGVVGAIRNCCFESEYHSWLLSDEVDILPKLLLPLADGTEYDDEDNDKLPLELQYLPEDKRREEDPDIRCMLLEALIQLCSRKENRVYVREKNTYVILRELHKWEEDRKALLACENLVDILIRTEEEIGEEDLKNVEVPGDLQEKFKEMDEEFLRKT